MRTNANRDKIIDALTQDHLLSLEALQARLPEVDFSTIYRNVQQLVKDKKVKKVVLDSKLAVYELASHRHDHFVCDSCEQVEVVDMSTAPLGNRTVRDVVVRGQCESCITEEV